MSWWPNAKEAAATKEISDKIADATALLHKAERKDRREKREAAAAAAASVKPSKAAQAAVEADAAQADAAQAATDAAAATATAAAAETEAADDEYYVKRAMEWNAQVDREALAGRVATAAPASMTAAAAAVEAADEAEAAAVNAAKRAAERGAHEDATRSAIAEADAAEAAAKAHVADLREEKEDLLVYQAGLHGELTAAVHVIAALSQDKADLLASNGRLVADLSSLRAAYDRSLVLRPYQLLLDEDALIAAATAAAKRAARILAVTSTVDAFQTEVTRIASAWGGISVPGTCSQTTCDAVFAANGKAPTVADASNAKHVALIGRAGCRDSSSRSTNMYGIMRHGDFDTCTTHLHTKALLREMLPYVKSDVEFRALAIQVMDIDEPAYDRVFAMMDALRAKLCNLVPLVAVTWMGGIRQVVAL